MTSRDKHRFSADSASLPSFKPNKQLLKGFLQTETHRKLYEQAAKYPSAVNMSRLNQAFQAFYTEIQLTHYVSKTVTFYAKDYSMKLSRQNERELYLLDQPLHDDGDNLTLKEQIADDTIREGTLDEAIHNPDIYTAILQLSAKEKQQLEMYFVQQLTHREIAEVFGITQQAVSKTIQKSLNKLQNLLIDKGGAT